MRSARASKALVLVIAGMVLASCGGEEGEEAQTDAGSPAPTLPPDSSPPPSAGNQAPTISGSPASQVMADNLFEFVPNAGDLDGDSLSFSIQNRPAWADFDSDTGRLRGTPDQGDLGTYSGIRITVSDGEATASTVVFSVTVVDTALGSATLSWEPPTQKTDGSVVDRSGYKIYWGTSPGNYSQSTTVDVGLTTYVLEGLTPATWYFVATAFDSQGLESAFSNEASKEVL